MRIFFDQIGCRLNYSEMETLAGQLRHAGHTIVAAPEQAQVVIFNSCAVTAGAERDSRKRLNALHRATPQARIAVTGCWATLRPQQAAALPGVALVADNRRKEMLFALLEPWSAELDDAATLAHMQPDGTPFGALAATDARTARTRAFVKVQDGCNNRCTFCIIPRLRGDLVSRPAADVLREAERLVKAGVKELLVISQDTSAYGVDVKYEASKWRDKEVRAKFLDLSRELGSLGAWVRLHYVYPYPHVDEIMPLMADGVVLPYLDIPMQHGSPSVLKRMKRPASHEKQLARIQKWRSEVPNLALRSTFIVGFPGETEEEFDELLAFLDEAQLDRVGCFKFEPVRGAPANDLENAVPDEVKAQRYARFMETQQKISARRLKQKVGNREPVIIDRVENGMAVGRTRGDAPEIDGVVHIASRRPLKVGEIATVKIERADAYDLHGTVAGF